MCDFQTTKFSELVNIPNKFEDTPHYFVLMLLRKSKLHIRGDTNSHP